MILTLVFKLIIALCSQPRCVRFRVALAVLTHNNLLYLLFWDSTMW